MFLSSVKTAKKKRLEKVLWGADGARQQGIGPVIDIISFSVHRGGV